jgi:uncharacterized protein (UPF0332 family)
MKMTLQNWESNGWLKSHKTSRREISDLLKVVDREISDAGQMVISVEAQFTHAYQAALLLCTALLYASGFRASREAHHYRTISAMPLILGDERKGDADYLNACRNKRNDADYRLTGAITEGDANELLQFVVAFRRDAVSWLKANYPELIA